MATESRALLDDQIRALQELGEAAQRAYRGIATIVTMEDGLKLWMDSLEAAQWKTERLPEEVKSVMFSSRYWHAHWELRGNVYATLSDLLVEHRKRLSNALEHAEHLLGTTVPVCFIVAGIFSSWAHFDGDSSACRGAHTLLRNLARLASESVTDPRDYHYQRSMPEDADDLARRLCDQRVKEESGAKFWTLFRFAPPIDEFNRLAAVAHAETVEAIERLNQAFQEHHAGAPSASRPAPDGSAKRENTDSRTKRSTEPGEAEEKLISALTKHHEYAQGGCLNTAPIGNNKLAGVAQVSNSTASEFFKKHFGSHTKYRAMCRDTAILAAALKLLNRDFAPYHLYGSEPLPKGERDGE